MLDRKKLLVLLSDRVVRLVISVVASAVVARAIGPGEFGIVARALLFFSIADALVSFGLPGILPTRVAVTAGPLRARLLGRALVLRVAAATVAVAGVAALWGLMPAWGFGNAVILLAMLTVMVSNWTLFDAYFQGCDAPHVAAYAKTAVSLVFLLVRVAAAMQAQADGYTFVLIFLAEQAVLTLALATLAWVRRDRGAPDAQAASTHREILRYALPMWGSQVCTLLYMRVDQLLLSSFATPDVLGQYAISAQLAEHSFTLPVVLNSLLVARVGRVRQGGSEAEMSALMLRIYRLGFRIGLGLALCLCLASPLVIAVLYGRKYPLSPAYLSILALSLPFVVLGSLQSMAIFTGSRPSLLLQKTLLTSVFALPVSALAWFAGGPLALAACMVLIQAFSCVISNYWLDRAEFFLQLRAMNPFLRLPVPTP